MDASVTNTFRFRQNAWYGDDTFELFFPEQWTVHLVGNQPLPALSDERIQNAIKNPIGSPTLSEIAAGKNSAAILLDDLSRPTPTARLLPHVINELVSAGIAAQQITLVVAGGTHAPLSGAELLKKVGAGLPPGVQLMAHDCRQSLVDLGTTQHGTPIQINQIVVNSDLRIGIGCIYPHPSAGFSGGGKILVPGAAGFETVRALHDNFRGSRDRAGRIDTDFRDEIEEIVARIGLDFIVNVTLNQQREISAVFAGDRVQAFDRGVEYARSAYQVDTFPQADITIVDMYPFDAEFQYAYDRGFWPLELAKPDSSRVILAGCPQGLGGHLLFPVSDLFYTRFKRRIENFRLNDLLSVGDRLRALNKMLNRRKLQVFVVSAGLQEEQLKKTLPKGSILRDWDAMLELLVRKHGTRSGTEVVLYVCAPLMLPENAGLIA